MSMLQYYIDNCYSMWLLAAGSQEPSLCTEPQKHRRRATHHSVILSSCIRIASQMLASYSKICLSLRPLKFEFPSVSEKGGFLNRTGEDAHSGPPAKLNTYYRWMHSLVMICLSRSAVISMTTFARYFDVARHHAKGFPILLISMSSWFH